MDIGRVVGILIGFPLLGLIPAITFAFMFARCRRIVVALAAVAWLAYVPYELAMKMRILCSGECNIRVDLVLLYPVLVLLSLLGIHAFVRSLRHNRSDASRRSRSR